METLYKLTDRKDQTFKGTQWGEGVTHTASGEGDLCGPGWLHAYEDPVVAVLLNPVHAEFAEPHLWLAEGVVGLREHRLKVGCTELTTVKRIPLPKVTTEQRVRFGILCAMEAVEAVEAHGAYKGSLLWIRWANKWLSGEDRTAAEAEAAVEEARLHAPWAARYAALAARAAASCAWSPKIEAAIWGARGMAALGVIQADRAEALAEAAQQAEQQAARAAVAAARTVAKVEAAPLDLVSIARQALLVR